MTREVATAGSVEETTTPGLVVGAPTMAGEAEAGEAECWQGTVGRCGGCVCVCLGN